MKFKPNLSLLLAVCLTGTGVVAQAQDAPPPPPPPADADTGQEVVTTSEVEELEWSDYTIKAYTLSLWGGSFSGATYLDNKELGPRTVLTEGAGDIIGYDGEVLPESTGPLKPFYDAARKEIKAGDAFGARIGIYIADDFHLDLNGSYASGEAVTSMIFTDDPINAPDEKLRVQVDSDPGFKVYRGGISLMYNARPATTFGIVPRLGFGIGGIINRYSALEDKTGLYLEGNFGLTYELFDDIELAGQVDLTTFSFEVDELGYSEMVNYTTFSVGLSWFLDRVPEQVRAAHIAERN